MTDVANPLTDSQQPLETPMSPPINPIVNSGMPVPPSMVPPTVSDNNPMGMGNNPSVPAPQPTQPRPAPGSFAQKLLAAVGGVLTNMGDASQASKGLRPGEGALAGINNTLAAGDARIEAQKRYNTEQAQKEQARQDALTQQDRINKRADDEAAANIAKTTSRTLHNRTADYIMGDEQLDRTVTRDQHDLQTLESGDVPATVIQRGVDGNNINALIQQGKANGHEYIYKASGTKTVGTNEDGKPVRALVYDIVEVPQKWTPDKDQIARIKTVPGYEKYVPGTEMPGAQVAAVLSQADTIRTTKDMMNRARADAGLETAKTENEVDQAQFAKSGDWLRYLNTYKGNPVQAAQHILSDPVMAKKYPGLYNDVMHQFATVKDPTGTTEYETMRHQYETEAEQRIKDASNGQGGAAVPGGGAMTDDMKANIASLSKDKQAVVSKYDAPTQASLYSVAFGPGDVSIDAFPNRVSGKSGQLDRAHAEGVIRQLNPNWSEQQYKTTQAAYKQVTFGRNGQDVETYNNLLDHMSNAQDVIEDSFRHENPKALNVAINALEKNGWGTEATKIQTALEPVKTEFESLMNNGHALHADQQKLYDAMVNPAETPAQLETAFKNFGATGAVRLLGLNDQYKKIAGKNLPGILRKETLDSAKHLNLDPNTMKQLGTLNTGDTLFHNPNWTPGTPEEQQQNTDTVQQQQQASAEANSPQHVIFNAQAWAQAHPGQDVNAAIQFARSKGYEVK